MTISHEEMVQWQLAGISRASDAIERPIQSDHWSTPSWVEVRDARIVWGSREGHDRFNVTTGPAMLRDFVRLADAPPERIRRYAEQWGVLEICKHGLPAHHNPLRFADNELPITCCLLLRHDDHNWEPLASWRYFARTAQAMLNIASELHQGRPGRAADWKTVEYDRVPDPALEISASDAPVRTPLQDAIDQAEWRPWPSVASSKQTFAWWIDNWLSWGDVRVTYSWDGGPPLVKLGGGGLFGALATQLMLATARIDGLAHCSSCGRSYVPERKPRSDGKRNYCQECRGDSGKRAAWRDAQREYRQRKKLTAAPPSAS